DKAFESLLAAFELLPDDPQSQAEAEAAAKEVSGWTAMIAAYEKAIDSGMAEPIGLRLRLGRILVEEVDRLDDALVQYRAVCEAEPENEVALAALEQLYKQGGRAKELLAVYKRRSELATDPQQRRQILFEIARLYVEQLDQAGLAV